MLLVNKMDIHKEDRKSAKEQELVTILKKKLPLKLYSFKPDSIVPYHYCIYRKFPFNLVSNAHASVCIYKEGSFIEDDITIYKEKYPLLELLVKRIAEEFSKIKGRKMIIRYSPSLIE